jgi:hypothetical protein
MTVTELDLEFAAVTWMVNENVNSLNDKEKSFIDTLFTEYCQYTRGNKIAEKKTRYLLDVLVGKAILTDEEDSIHLEPFIREQAVFGMFQPSEEEIEDKQERVTLYEKTVSGPTIKQVKKERQKIQKTDLMGKTIRSVSEQGVSNDQIMNMLKLVAQQNLELQNQLSVHGNAMQEFSEKTEINRTVMEVQFHDIGKGMGQMDAKIRELYEMQLSKQSLTDLKWHQIPAWFREIYSGGIKRTAVGMVKLPFKIASIAVDRIIYRPMVRAYDFWGGKVELVVGTILWVVVVAGVIHIYQQTDWEKVNETYRKYGGEYMDKYLFSGVDLLKTTAGYFPKGQEVANSVKLFFFESVVDPVMEILYTFWHALIALLTMTANTGLSKLPYADWWFTPRTVAWPDSELFNAVKIYFGV